MSSKKSKTDLLVRVRFSNPLPPPPFPPKLLKYQTQSTRHATYGALESLISENELPLVVDLEQGLGVDVASMGGHKYWQGDRSVLSPSLPSTNPLPSPLSLDPEDQDLLQDPIPPTSTNTTLSHASGLLSTSSVNSLSFTNNPSTSSSSKGGGAAGAGGGPSGSGDDGTGAAGGGGTVARKRAAEVAWLRRTEYLGMGEFGISGGGGGGGGGASGGKRAMDGDRRGQTSSISLPLTSSERLAAIENTFTACHSTPLEKLKHPTKPHLTAVQTFDILPAEEVFGNRYESFKFMEWPGEKVGGMSSSQVPSQAPTDPSEALRVSSSILRSVEVADFPERISMYTPEDVDTAQRWRKRRLRGKTVDGEGLGGVEGEEAEGEDTEETYSFNFLRTYDRHHSRQTPKEFAMIFEEGESGPIPQSETDLEPVEIDDGSVMIEKGAAPSSTLGKSKDRKKGVYYVPLKNFSVLRKRRKAARPQEEDEFNEIAAEEGIELWESAEIKLTSAFQDLSTHERRRERVQEVSDPDYLFKRREKLTRRKQSDFEVGGGSNGFEAATAMDSKEEQGIDKDVRNEQEEEAEVEEPGSGLLGDNEQTERHEAQEGTDGAGLMDEDQS